MKRKKKIKRKINPENKFVKPILWMIAGGGIVLFTLRAAVNKMN